MTISRTSRHKREINWLLNEKYGGHIPKKSAVFLRDIKRIMKGEPVDYVIGSSPFLGSTIDLSYKPLIPRPETEYWVERAIEDIAKKHTKNARLKFLDMCAGSGCIGIALAKHFPKATVHFGEISPAALAQIKKNCRLNGLKGSRIKVIKSDLFSKIKGEYDHIFVNPPYLTRDRKMTTVQRSVLLWEPAVAVFAKKKGLGHIFDILDGAREHLRTGGQLYIEFDPWQKKEIARHAKAAGFSAIAFQADQYKRTRVFVGQN
jgi:release factor glutamine methyltransferase